MSESKDWIMEGVQHERELAERREAWEQHKQAEAEQRARDEKQRRLEAYLLRRGEAFRDHTGSLPPRELLQQWRDEYASERAAEEEQERERRYAEAEDVWS